jgi:hypothetical protein
MFLFQAVIKTFDVIADYFEKNTDRRARADTEVNPTFNV